MQIYTLSHVMSRQHRAALIELDTAVFGNESAWSNAAFDSPVARKFEVSVIAFMRDQVAGFAVASRSDAESVHIHRIAVDPAFRNLRVGRHLINAVEERALDIGASRATLEFADSLNVAGFYDSLGYSRASTSVVRDYLKHKNKQTQEKLYLPLEQSQRIVYLKPLTRNEISVSGAKSETQDHHA